MFIRVKNIKNQHYAYKVRNRWTKKGTRQKTAGYLGKVYHLKPVFELTFEDFLAQDIEVYIKNISSKEIILDLVKFELLRHGFKYKGNNQNILIFNNIAEEYQKSECKTIQKMNNIVIKAELAPSILTITDTKKPIVLALNNDFLCDYTLRKLARFKSFSSEEECGKELAKVFITAGIPPRPDIFVRIFHKVYSKYGSYVK
ncbi:MAG: hypothetical protein ABIG89_00515 [Candidatus Woesearchaeota archaeon]